ncbi:MAG TPA: DHH family phosphoesterase [Candidatus Saccharimonadales bacterium]|nr:DHH family phosphoesterase [Candidatus Saccharimonadales bacterium]
MDEQKKHDLEFKHFVENSKKILITSHISPDPDAVCSVLLLGTTLKSNFPDKEIKMVLEEKPARTLDFLEGYSGIEFRPLLEAAQELKPDLFILLDAPNFERCSRDSGVELRELLDRIDTRVAIIDHHEEHGKDNSDLYVNNKRPATAQEVYELLFEKLHLMKPDGYAQTTLLGIISDTARHKFDNPVHRDTYRAVSDLLDAGASIEELETKMDRYDRHQLKVLNNLIKNTASSGQGYTYSFIDDSFTQNWIKSNKPLDSFKLGFEEFTNNFLKNFEDNLWGFAVYKEMVGDDSTYGVSFRSKTGVKDVSKIAHKLGGGGHKAAAGAKFKADSVQQALEKVKKAVESSEDN